MPEFSWELLPDFRTRVTHNASGITAIGNTRTEAEAEALRLVEQAEREQQVEASRPKAVGVVPLNVLGAAIYISVLAYPDNADQQERFMNAVGAWLSKTARKRGKLTLKQARAGEWPTSTRNRDIGRAILAGFRRLIRDRLPIVEELFSKQWRMSFDAPETMRPFFEGVARRWEQQGYSGNEAQADNAARRWAEIRPVLHLAQAFYEKAMPHCAGPDVVQFFYHWEEWLEPALLRAEELRQAWTMADGRAIRIDNTGAALADAMPALRLHANEVIKLLPSTE